MKPTIISVLREKFDRTSARVLSVQATVILTAVYWILAGYMLLIKRSHGLPGGWHPWVYKADTLEDLLKQW
jgi:hypothetical protein